MLEQAGHGDLYLRRVTAIEVPSEVRQRLEGQSLESAVLAYGERSGHAHVLTSEKALGYIRNDDAIAYVLLRDAGLLEHTPNGADHGRRLMAPGYYVVTTERDFTWENHRPPHSVND